MFIIVPRDKDEKAHLCERITSPLAKQKDAGEIRIFEIDGDRPIIEEVDENGNNEELAMQW